MNSTELSPIFLSLYKYLNIVNKFNNFKQFTYISAFHQIVKNFA